MILLYLAFRYYLCSRFLDCFHHSQFLHSANTSIEKMSQQKKCFRVMMIHSFIILSVKWTIHTPTMCFTPPEKSKVIMCWCAEKLFRVHFHDKMMSSYCEHTIYNEKQHRHRDKFGWWFGVKKLFIYLLSEAAREKSYFAYLSGCLLRR